MGGADHGALESIMNSGVMNALLDFLGDNPMLETLKVWFPKAVTDVCDSKLGSIIDIVVPIAIGIMSIYFTLDLISKSTTSNFSMEVFVRSLLKLVIGFAIISNCDALADGVISFGNGLVEMLSNGLNGTDFSYASNAKNLIKYMQDHDGWLGGAKFVVNMYTKIILEAILGAIVNLMIKFVAYNRAIKIFIYRALLPIAVADIFGKGIYNGALGPIKRLLGLAVQYPMIYVIGVLTCVFVDEIDVLHTNWIALMGQVVMIFIAVIGTVKKSSDEAMSIFR